MASEKQQFIATWDSEFGTTRKLIAAVPEGKRDFKPHEKSMTTRELAWHLVGMEKFFVEGCLARGFRFEKGPEPPAAMGEIVSLYDRQHRDLVQRVQAAPPAAVEGTVQFYIAPKQMGDVPIMAILWRYMLMHSIHHRGQLSVYLRAMGERVPSIYGPSLDEPWM
jgi:uncharacterized damage-inducible protein DinB